MTVTEIAKANGVTTQAVYKRLKSAKISIKSLKNGDQLTEEGVNQINNLFRKVDKPVNQPETVDKPEHAVDEPEKNVDKPKADDQLYDQIAELEKENAELRSERDYLRGALAQAQTALNQAQMLHAATIRAQLPPSGGFVQWIKSKLQKRPHTNDSENVE